MRSAGRTAGRSAADMSMPLRLAVVVLGFILLAGIIGAAFYVGFKWLSRSPFFTVNGVTINGCQRVNEETVLDLSGVKPDSNLLALDLDTMAHAIEQHPWIKSAAISKKLPDRLDIEITERVPVAIIGMGSLYLVDAGGTVFKKIEKGERFDLPLITGISVNDKPSSAEPDREVSDTSQVTETGQTDVSEQQEVLSRILELIALASKGTRTLGVNNISEIHAEGRDIILYTADRGLPMRFSGDAPLRLQFRRAEKVLHHLYSSGKYKKIAMVDLYYGNSTALAKLKN